MANGRETSNERAERIARIRREIAAGTYETPAKLARALDAFLDCQQPGRGRLGQEEK